jgi:hypothetical protein
VVIHAYNHHVRLLSPEPLVFDKPQSTRVSGADVVMQSSGYWDQDARYPRDRELSIWMASGNTLSRFPAEAGRNARG